EHDDLGAGEQQGVHDARAHLAPTDDPGPGGHPAGGHCTPPVASSTVPVTQLASSSTSIMTAPAMSSGVPRRFMALLFAIASTALSAVIERMYSVSVEPGRTALTVTPRFATSLAVTRVAASRPALAAA